MVKPKWSQHFPIFTKTFSVFFFQSKPPWNLIPIVLDRVNQSFSVTGCISHISEFVIKLPESVGGLGLLQYNRGHGGD